MTKKARKEMIVDVLNDIIEEEEQRICASYPRNDAFLKKMILFELIRSFDSFFVLSQKNEDLRCHYEYGLNRALKLLYGKYTNEIGYPLGPSNKHSWEYANSIIQHCGRIEFCRRIIAFIKADLVDVSMDSNTIEVVFQKRGVKELLDNEAHMWARDLLEGSVVGPQLRRLKRGYKPIKRLMRSKVDKWRKHFIQYDTCPEIDNYFEEFSYYSLFPITDKEEFPHDAIFGGIPYSDYCELIMVVCGIALKHYHFCLELLDKEKELNPLNLLTIPRDRNGLIESMSMYLEMSPEKVEQMLDCISLNSDNYLHQVMVPGGPPAPFIRIAKNSLVHSVAASQINPFDFLNRELKRRFEKDYFNAVNMREAVFRRQLYELFQGEHYCKRDKAIKIISEKGTTDIDAAIYDKDTGVLGIFQLKWQDVYGNSLKERFSRIKNLYPKAIEWIDKVESWILSNRNKDLLNRLFSLSNHVPKKIFIFVICRHNTFFTGYDVDKRAAWSSVWYLLKVLNSKIPKNSTNQIEELYNELKKIERDINTRKRPETGEDEFNISGYRIILKSS